tara:strand:+ start:166 stop:549 length:384 start_codon:yes stop_codon:yes gene_type:complete
MALTKVGSHPSHGGQVVFNATASFTLDPSDSGKTFILKDAAVTVTLPTLSTNLAGFQINLISGDDSEHILSGGASKIYAIVVQTTATTRTAAASTLTLSAGQIGDTMKVSTDGTNWYVQCLGNAAAS